MIQTDRFKQFQARFLAGELTEADFEGMTPEDSVRARVEATDYHRMAAGEVVRADKKTKRRHRFVMSSEAPCGQWCDVVLSDAWDLADFKKQGSTLLFAHDGSQPPLGRVDNPSKVKATRTLEGMVQFMDEGISEFADMIALMVDRGIITNGSVGFHIEDGRPPTKEEIKKRKLKPHSMIITRAKLKEFSIVPVGADPNAIKVRGAELRRALNGLVEGEFATCGAVEEFMDAFDLWVPNARRSIVVPQMSWRSEPDDSEPEVTEDEPESPAETVDQNGEALDELREMVADQERLIGEQAESIEALTERLSESEAAVSRLEQDLHQARTLVGRINVLEGVFGIQIPAQERKPEPLYAGLLSGDFDLN